MKKKNKRRSQKTKKNKELSHVRGLVMTSLASQLIPSTSVDKRHKRPRRLDYCW